MIKKTITYDNFADETVSEDFYFHLGKLELVEMELSFEGGLDGYIAQLSATENGKDAYYLFKDIILKAVGKRSEDGKQFIKTQEYRDAFEQSPALGELIFSFLENSDNAADFVNGLLPGKLVAEAKAREAQESAESTDISDEDLLKMNPQEMTAEQLRRAFLLKNGQ